MHKETRTEFRFEKIKDRDGAVVAFEILSDFEHPWFWRMNAPDCFRIAESLWKKQEMDFLVLRNALDAAAAMRSGASFSVNLHPSTVVRPDFLKRLAAAVKESRIDPKKIIIELVESESDGLGYPPSVKESVALIRKMGISVALDDFDPDGPHSVLALRSLGKIDVVKIDGRLVEEAKNGNVAEIVAAVDTAKTELPRSRIVAERVSSLATYVLLHGCDARIDAFQGRGEYQVPNGCKNVLFP